MVAIGVGMVAKIVRVGDTKKKPPKLTSQEVVFFQFEVDFLKSIMNIFLLYRLLLFDINHLAVSLSQTKAYQHFWRQKHIDFEDW